MKTLLQLIIPIFMVWLVWKAFRAPQRGNTRSSGPSDTTSCSGNRSQGVCDASDDSSCDGCGGNN